MEDIKKENRPIIKDYIPETIYADIKDWPIVDITMEELQKKVEDLNNKSK